MIFQVARGSNTISAVVAYEVVNAMLSVVGEVPIAIPSTGTDREKVGHLLKTYTDRLQQAIPAYRDIKDTRLIPDMGVHYILSILENKNL